MIRNDELSREDSLQIAITILDVFQKLGNYIDFKQDFSNNFNFPQLTTIACRLKNKIEITTTQAKNGEEKFFQELPNHIYKLIWYNRLFLVSFYTSPKILGYYSALPNCDKIPYLFCSIIEMQNRLHKRAPCDMTERAMSITIFYLLFRSLWEVLTLMPQFTI